MVSHEGNFDLTFCIVDALLYRAGRAWERLILWENKRTERASYDVIRLEGEALAYTCMYTKYFYRVHVHALARDPLRIRESRCGCVRSMFLAGGPAVVVEA